METQYTDETLITALFACNNREDGIALLNTHANSVAQIRNLCDKLDLQKSSKSNNIASIIENTIGFRLRSAAIQGT